MGCVKAPSAGKRKALKGETEEIQASYFPLLAEDSAFWLEVPLWLEVLLLLEVLPLEEELPFLLEELFFLLELPFLSLEEELFFL